MAIKKEFYCYMVNIEDKEDGSSKLITMLKIPKNLMADNIITYSVNDIVSYASNSNVVTFDFKKTTFKYQLNQKVPRTTKEEIGIRK